METGKGIKVRDAAVPQRHFCVVTKGLPQDWGEPGWCVRGGMKKEQASSFNKRQVLTHFSSLLSVIQEGLSHSLYSVLGLLSC